MRQQSVDDEGCFHITEEAGGSGSDSDALVQMPLENQQWETE